MVPTRHGVSVGLTAILLLSAAARTLADEPAPLPKLKVEGPAHARVVAYIFGNTPITRDDLTDFLIARGGADKLELLVNKRIVETEAARRNVTVTAGEVEIALKEDLKGVERKEIVSMILRRYGKSLYEWREDVVKPRLLLGKMVRDRVQATDDEIKKLHEVQYGGTRPPRAGTRPETGAPGAPPPGPPSAQVVAAVRGSEVEFDKVAANQADPRLAESRGQIAPVSRNPDLKDPAPVNTLFGLQAGRTSDLFESQAGWMVVQCTGIIPPDPEHALDKPTVRAELEREVLDKKIGQEIPKLFDELKKQYKAAFAYQPAGDVKPASFTAPAPPLPHGPPEQVLATVAGPNGPIQITRADLGEFLIARGGGDKLELVVNRRIVQMEAVRRGVNFTQAEVDAAFDEMVKAAGVPKDVFVDKVLPGNKKTVYEYIEDVVKPDVVLRKMVRDRVKVGEDDVKRAFERAYGEKRDCQIITWRKGEEKAALKEWSAIRNGEVPFDKVARMQADPNLAAAAGRIKPIGKHLEADDTIVEKVAFGLAGGEISHLLQTRTGTMCIRCTGIIPPDKTVKFEDVRPRLEREEFEKAVTREIPKFFTEIKQAAAPTLLLQTAPDPQIINQAVRTRVNEVLQEKK